MQASHKHRAIVTHAHYRPPAAGGAFPRGSYTRPEPRIESRRFGALAAGELRIEIERVGICGSDLGVMQTDPVTGCISSTVPLSIPDSGRVLGHEGIGVVREVGHGVTTFQPGDWVTLKSIVCCQQCAPCRRGHFNQCLEASLLGFQRDGIFAEMADVPAQLAAGIGDLAGTEPGRQAAACIEPAACALVALQSASMQPGDRVLVMGAGPIGLFAAMLCRQVFGAASVDVVEPAAFRRRFARKWADRVHAVDEFLGASDSGPYDVMVEASGSLGNLDVSLRRMAANARIVLLARGVEHLHVGAVDHIVTNGLCITGSRGHLGGAFETILSLCLAEKLALHEVVTGVLQGLDAIHSTLERPLLLSEQHCKLQVRL